MTTKTNVTCDICGKTLPPGTEHLSGRFNAGMKKVPLYDRPQMVQSTPFMYTAGHYGSQLVIDLCVECAHERKLIFNSGGKSVENDKLDDFIRGYIADMIEEEMDNR